MAQYFIGEVRLVGFNYATVDWAFCQGQSVSISDNAPLYNLIGTTYGGDGQSTFNLPDLRGRIPLHQGSNGTTSYSMGQIGGQQSVSLTSNQFPQHSHILYGSNNPGGSNSPNGSVVAGLSDSYSTAAPTTPMNPTAMTASQGGGLPHENMQPYLVMNWIIALYGVFPTRG